MSNMHEAEQADRKNDEVRVSFIYLNTNEEVEFFVPSNETLNVTWNLAYEKLEEAKKDGDMLECQDGADLTPYLNISLYDLHAKHVCVNRKFQIRCKTGGA